MKILTGSLKGQSIVYRPNPHLRPTADKVRKALFDALQGRFEGKVVLDLFSGTGALGFEALSHGAERVTFVEKDRGQCAKIIQTTEKLELDAKVEVLCADALEALSKFSLQSRFFDIVFMDPPYEKGLCLKALETIGASSLIGQGTLLIAESRKREIFPKESGKLKRIKEKVYGDTQIGFYQAP